MVKRCNDSKTSHYHNYGGRGIKVCKKWQNDPRKFIAWAENNGWKKGLQIDRIDNDGNYSPSNCRITTNKVNSNNRRGNVLISAFGEQKTISQWQDDSRCVAPYHAVYDRIFVLRWPPEQAITIPVKPGNNHTLRTTQK
jgi:hypothetical protein